MPPIDIPWVCKTCGKECYPWDNYLKMRRIPGKPPRRVNSIAGSVLEHRMETGHQTYSRRLGPRI